MDIEIYTDRYEREHGHDPQDVDLALHAGLQLDHRKGPLPRPQRKDDLPQRTGEGSRGRTAAEVRADHRRAMRRPVFSSEKPGYQR